MNAGGGRDMRQFLLVFVLCLAGCGEASRGFSETEYLQNIDNYLQADDRCGVHRYVVLRPRALYRDDELSRELRDFVRNSREECSPPVRPGSNGSRTDQQGNTLENANNRATRATADNGTNSAETNSKDSDEIERDENESESSASNGNRNGNGNGKGNGNGNGNGKGNGKK